MKYVDGMVSPEARASHPTAWTSDAALIAPEPWMSDGLCAETDPEAFFPEKGGSTRDAKRICNGNPAKDDEPGCPVREQCLAYALRTDERFGIWGGLSERERRKLRRLNPSPSPQVLAGRKGAAARLAKQEANS